MCGTTVQKCRLDLEFELAKSTILAHLVQVRDQDRLDLERDLEKRKIGLDTHIFPRETTFLQTTSGQGSRTGCHCQMQCEILHALGIMTIESNSSSRCNRPFARLENRKLLLRFDDGAHHVVC